MDNLPETLPAGTRYSVNGYEFELLGPSTVRENGTYPVPARRFLANGYASPAPVGYLADHQSLDLRDGTVVLPASVSVIKRDPYAEHRKRIGDDK